MFMSLLPVEDVAQHPPEQYHNEKEPDEQPLIEPKIQFRIANTLRLGIDAHGNPGNRDKKQRIVLERCHHIAIEQSMDSALTAAARTFISCEFQERTLREQSRRRRVKCIIHHAHHHYYDYRDKQQKSAPHRPRHVMRRLECTGAASRRHPPRWLQSSTTSRSRSHSWHHRGHLPYRVLSPCWRRQ